MFLKVSHRAENFRISIKLTSSPTKISIIVKFEFEPQALNSPQLKPQAI